MQKKSIVLIFLSVFVTAFLLSGCAALQKPTESNFKDPVVTLDMVDVAHYWGFWVYNPKIKPAQGTAGHSHCVTLTPADFAVLQAAGTVVTWSPAGKAR